ncbi:MAG: lipoyl domain-containing protein [Planctomycetes bacterium]|nr:lipoyl domain-containing protein [Planctomycetota bacterium]
MGLCSSTPPTYVPVVLPDLGTADEPMRLSAWYVEPGDLVEAGEPLLEVMITGITCDIPAPAAGTVIQQCVALDATVSPGDVVAKLKPHD